MAIFWNRLWAVFRRAGVVLMLFALGSGSWADEAPDYLREIKPLVAARCVKCHGPEKQENGLRLDTAGAMRTGGDAGPAILPGKSAESLLIVAALGKSDEISRMPPEGEPLTAAEIALLAKWIDGGAKAPEEKLVAASNTRHWAYQLPQRVNPPSVQRASWPENAIDSFILERLEREGVTPSEPAERAVLLRRAALDLVGLPPTAEDVLAFAAERAPDAYERAVDRFFASPHYGERWGRHWLDLARYADSNGYTRDFGRSIWRYRDWVISALNRGQPFDQFTIDQLAGDMLPGATAEQLIATGFHRNTLFNEEGGTDQEQFRIEAVVDRVNTTGAVYLGLSLGCARCHTHKYDPISHAEYYQFFALLNNCDEPTFEAPTELQLFRGELPVRDKIRQQIQAAEAELEKQRTELEAAQQAWEKSVTPMQRSRLPGPVQVAYDMEFAKRDAANKKLVEDYFKTTDEARKQFPLVAQIYDLRQREPKIPTTMILRERSAPRETYVHKRGDFLDKGPPVTGAVPAVLPPLSPQAGKADRLALAQWLVSPVNPLTPRVTMNRDWQRFFGTGIVETDDDFGSQGTPPSHPALLDFLAVEFVRSGWDSKAMQRRMVQSATYRQSSRKRGDLAQRDPGNRWLARQNRLRLDAEVVRDAALAASGLLTRVLGGPSVFPPQPEGVFDFTQDPKPWNPAAGADRFRRGMYTHFWRSAPYPSLMVFDAPGGNLSCTRRVRSNTPLQALTLANDQAYVECAQALGERLDQSAETLGAEATITRACLDCLSRPPSAAEKDRLLQLLTGEEAYFSTHASEAAALSQSLVVSSAPPPNGSPALLARRAAWTQLARVLLNLDETITRE